jgi:Tetratricopeptide repeat.
MNTTETEKALEFKNKGNEYFKKKDYLKAIECYTNAISKNSFSNRITLRS